MRSRSITARELAETLNCELKGNGGTVLSGVTTLIDAKISDLTFLANPKYRSHLEQCQAGAIIVPPNEMTPDGMVRLETLQPYTAFRKALALIYPDRDQDLPLAIDPRASISEEATVGEGVQVGAFATIAPCANVGNHTRICNGAYIGEGVVIGEQSVIGVNAVIRHDVKIGNRVVIGDGTVIGFDGFGYSPESDGFHKIPQVGIVVIDDDVEIGANCCVDRATVGSTRIGKGSKLDNLIQVAHGVHIGRNTVIAAQTGISGSTNIGSGVMMGGQAGTVGHIDIGDGMLIGAQAGVTKSFDIKGAVSGYPARPQMEAMRIEASLNKLPELLKRVKSLEAEVKKLSEK